MLKYLTILFMSAFLAGCNLYPTDDIRTEDLDSVITFFDREKDLSGYDTYYLSDDVLPITSDTTLIDDPDDILNPDPVILQFLLDKVEENMDALGYTRVGDPDDADLRMGAGYIVVNTTVVGTYPCGGYYYGWYGGYWGSWYPYYPYYPYDCVYSYSYDIGTVLITMFDGKNIDVVEETIPSIWTAIMRGLANTSDALDRADIAIDQAFDQSPILVRSGS